MKTATMKKGWIILCVMLAVCGCEKPTISNNHGEESVDGNLKVRVFEIEKTPFASRTRGAAKEACTRLNYAVYTPDGTRVKQVNQTSDASSFGTASFQLGEGDYLLVVVGHSSLKNPTMTDLNKIQFKNADGFTDTFLYYGHVTIGEEPVNLQVSLDRIVSLCRFVITDDIPEEVTQMRFYYTGGSGAFDATTGLGCVNSKQDVYFDVTAGQRQFDLYTFLHDREGTIHLTVTAYDDDDNILQEREFHVPMQQNYITWVSGAYFNGTGASSTVTDVSVNTDWAGETHINF
ncbi:MAG: FimB/Mfa2 family fimbrial subunit [Prevotella sp.]|nr:FimB/Mfa2 family fimbrial subunit [Prevotella sp.]